MRSRPVRLAAVCAVLAMAPAVAGAQDRLFIQGREVGAFGHFNEDLGPAPPQVAYPRFGGDRFVHVPGRGVVDLTTGSTLPLGEGGVMAYDKARPHVFIARDGGVWQEDVRTSWAVLILPRLDGLAGCIHATSADVLVCAYARGDGQYDLLRPAPFGPVLVATVRFGGFGLVNRWVATPDGLAIYLHGCTQPSQQVPGSCMVSDIARVDVLTGAVRWSGANWYFFSDVSLQWDDVHDRLFAVSSRVDVFARDLAPLGSATGGRCRSVAISPHTDRIYLALFDYYFSAGWTRLSAYDASSYALVAAPRERTGVASCGNVTLFTAPGAPRNVWAFVRGDRVDLGWTNIGAASHFVLDIGLAPGRTDLSVFAGTEPSAAFSGVPPGTYYVRVRGGNLHGGSRPSAELVVAVR